MAEKTVYDVGQGAPFAPSVMRSDPLGWLAASAVAGFALFLFTLALLWRPLPGLPGPQGALSEHFAIWAKLALRLIAGSVFSNDVKSYALFWDVLPLSGKVAIAWRCAVGFAASLAPAVLLAKGFLRPKDGLLHMRGSRRFEGPEALAILRSRLSKRAKLRPDHEIAPGVIYPGDMWTRHVLVVGGVGSGKSTAIKPLIQKIVASGEQMILFDPKSDFTMAFSTPELVAPWDERSLSWDIARDMRNPLDMRRFAAAMISASHDPMWSNASRQLLVGLMIYLKGTRGSDWGWRELADLVSLPQASLLPIMRTWHPEAVRAVEKASVTTIGILINLSSFCSAIFDLAEAWGDAPPGRRISFVDWTQGRSKHRQIILQGHGAYSELTKGYVEGIVGVISAMVNSVEIQDDAKRKIWFIADEFGQMGKIPVRPLFEVGRSRGVRCVVACQDFAQLEEIYGAPMVKAIVAMSGTLLVGQMMQGETAEQLCKAFGTREVERANVSSSANGPGAGFGRSSTLSFNRDEVPLYKPSELSSRLGLNHDATGVKLVLFTGGDAFELTWPLFPERRARAAHKPAAWTLGPRPSEDVATPPPLAEDARAAIAEMRANLAEAPQPREAADAGPRVGATVSNVGADVVVAVAFEGLDGEPMDSHGAEAGPLEDAAMSVVAGAVAGGAGEAIAHLASTIEAASVSTPGPRQVVSNELRAPKERG